MTDSTRSTFSVTHITGEGAKAFLQSQFSNDIELIEPGHCQLNGYCNPKGRLLATFYLGFHNKAYYLICDQTVVESLIKRLRLYVLRAKVVFNLQAERVAAFSNETQLHKDNDTILLQTPAPLNCQFVIAGEQKLDQIIAENSNQPLNLICEMILNGVPNIVAQTLEKFIPQDVNLDLAGGVSFTKGCYPGQEIVARVHYRGKAKNRMFYATVANSKLVEVGVAVFAEDRENQKSGEIAAVSSAVNSEKVIQAVLPEANVSKRRFYLENDKTAEISLQQQPYEVT
ncbi:MAG: YgfZ/GcvT domain-containing protein [Arenicellales bacterium WSBS_2016_MAG_OTU3]